MAFDLDALRSDIENKMSEGDMKSIGIALGKAFVEIEPSQHIGFSDVLRGVVVAAPEEFDKEVYPRMMVKGRKASDEKWMDLEKTFLERHGLHSGEYIVKSFKGVVEDKWKKWNKSDNARIYLTNMRIIVCGIASNIGKGTDFGLGLSIAGLAISAISVCSSLKTSARIQADLKSNKEVIPLGYCIPVDNPRKIKRDKKTIKYKATIPYNNGHKESDVEIMPQAMKSQSTSDWKKTELPQILDSLESFLQGLTDMQC